MPPDPHVHPDIVMNVSIEHGTLRLSRAYDLVHRFAWLNFHILKYFKEDNTGVANITVSPEGAQFLLDACGLYLLDRSEIGQHEYDLYLEYQGACLDEAAMGLGD